MADASTPGARIARYYDLDLQDDPGDLDLYLAMAARTGGPILELAGGSGRLALPLALAGHAVTVVDNDPHMLARARDSWSAARPAGGRRTTGSLELVEADLTTVALGRRFGLACIALNSLLLLDGPDAQRQAIQVLADHLRPGGVAIIDHILPDAADLGAYDGRLFLDWIREDPVTGDLVTKLSSARHDPATASVTMTTLFDTAAPGSGALQRTVRVDRIQLQNASELLRDATDAGLEIELITGDHQGTPFGPGSDRIVLIAVSV